MSKHFITFSQEELDSIKNGEIVVLENYPWFRDERGPFDVHFVSEDKYEEILPRQETYTHAGYHQSRFYICPNIEANNLALMDTRCCRTCKHFGELDMESSCAPCYGYSNWEFKK